MFYSLNIEYFVFATNFRTCKQRNHYFHDRTLKFKHSQDDLRILKNKSIDKSIDLPIENIKK